MSKKEQTRTQVPKQPKTVQVKLLVPYMIILVMAVSLASLVTGWMLRSAHYSEIKAEVATQVAEVTKVKKANQ